MIERIQKFLRLKTIKTKVFLSFVIGGGLLLIMINLTMANSLFMQEVEMVEQREVTDLKYMEDMLADGPWHIQDHAIYKGDVLIGDGTEENANIEPFVEMEEKTGTFFYTFMATEYVDKDVKAEIDKKDKKNTDFIRAAGSTKGPNGESIVGTYIDRKVSNQINANGIYSGSADVQGREIYCWYKGIEDTDGNVIGVLVCGRSIEEINGIADDAKHSLIWVVLIMIFAIFSIMVAILSRWISSLNKAKNYLKQVGTGQFPEEKLDIKSRDEMGEMAASINDMTESLKEKERIGAELNLATEIQANMLPSIFPPFPERDDFELHASMRPAKEVGGDFYDFFMVDEKHLAFIIADVSGKGVPAALFMVIAKTHIKNYIQAGYEPGDVFTIVNQRLCEGNEMGLFVTAWMGMLNLETGKLKYVNAGHNPPLLKSESGDYEYLVSRAAFVLGGMEGMRYRQYDIFLKPGDRLYLYTDGVTEATDSSNRLYGEERLKNYLNAHKELTVDKLIEGVSADIDEFVGEAEQFDDITMLTMYYEKYMEDNSISRTVPAELGQWDGMAEFIQEELEKVETPLKVQMKILIAAEEIFVNIARYAYGNGSGTMKLELSYDDNSIRLKFIDSGMPFDPFAQTDPDITLSAEERSIGGLGIFMVKKTMDNVEYKYEDGQNKLTISKKVK